MNSPAAQLDLLLQSGVVLADGATGSELHRRGMPTPLPLWSTAALFDPAGQETLRQIHADYVRAGAHLLTANTFRTHARNLRSVGNHQHGVSCEGRAAELTQLAVRIARDAAEQAHSKTGEDNRAAQPVLVAGSQAPLEDCYSPDLTPDESELRREHRQMAEHLANSGVDLILIETMPTVREAIAAAEAAAETRLPFAVSFVCDAQGRLLSGESLPTAVAGVLPFQPRLLGVNCAPATKIDFALQQLAESLPSMPASAGRRAEIALIAYGNIGEPDPDVGWRNTIAEQPEEYARMASAWPERGVKVIGGCCGTTPAHIAALRRRFGT